jgi:glycosyltransferase involved in cell wall biosynthesis
MIEKLLLITKWYPVSVNDDQRTKAIKNIYEGLVNYGVSVTVLVPRPEFTSLKVDTINNIKVISVPELHYTNAVTVPEYNFFINNNYGSLLNILRLLKYNITYSIRLSRKHIRNFARLIQRKGVLFYGDHIKRNLIKRDLKQLLTELGPFDKVVIHGLPGRHVKYLDCNETMVNICLHNTDVRSSETQSFLSNSLERLDRVFYRSHSIHTHFVESEIIPHDKESHIVYSGVSESALVQREDYRDWAQGNTLKLVCVASLIPRKNVALLLNTLERFDDADWSLDVIGTGPELDSLRETATQLNIHNQVTFHGKLPHEQVMKSYINFDMFVLVSENETFGMVYTEAMSRGLVVIGSKGEGIDGLISDGVNGFLASPKDSDDLLSKLKTFVKMSSEERSEMKDNIYRTVTSFSHERVVQDYFEHLSAGCSLDAESADTATLSS